MARRTILVVEDDPAIRRGVVDALRFANYDVLEEEDGAGAQEAMLKADCDLVLLDLVLPGANGLDLLAKVRPARPTLPVIIMTARGEEEDRIAGLRVGADDYVVKPFSVRELLARVDAVLRRSPERPTDLSQHRFTDGTIIDFERREIRFAEGEPAALTEKEALVLRHLARNIGRAISRDELLTRVWRINPRAIVETRTVDMTIARLREKLRDDPASPRLILTVRSKGYMLGSPEEGAP